MADYRVTFSIIAIVVSLSGLIWQVAKVSEQYFRYSTLTQLSINRKSKIVPPSFTICFGHQQFPKTTIGYNRTSRLFESPAAVFKATPSVDQMFRGCILRSTRTSKKTHFKFPNQTIECYRLFDIIKLNKQAKVCYQFEIKSNDSFDYRLVGSGYDMYSEIFTLELMPLFIQHTYMFYYLTPRGQKIYGTSRISSELFRHLNTTSGVGKSNGLTANWKKQTIVLLPAPYQTDCVDYSTIGYESRSHCSDKCLIDGYIDQFGKLPFDVSHYEFHEWIDKKYLFDESNDDPKQIKIRAICDEKCKRPDCYFEDMSSKFVGPEEKEFIYISLYPPDEPEVVVKHAPQMELLDFVTYILSCISFWFGWSPFYSLKDHVTHSVAHVGQRKRENRRIRRVPFQKNRVVVFRPKRPNLA